MRVAVLQFPGSNCDQDCVRSVRDDCGYQAEFVWHRETSLDGFDAVIIPGGFSYGDYLRCGAMAKQSPIMQAVLKFAAEGKPVLGICNGFQILCEVGLLPGALVRNESLHFLCEPVTLRVENGETPFTSTCQEGQLMRLPIAHGEGCYFADEATLDALEANKQVVFRYVDPGTGAPGGPEANPNGSKRSIAGICNAQRNVLGLMPHPDRATHPRLGFVDGKMIFEAMAAA